MAYTFPATDWQRRELLLSALGSFWSATYDDNAVAESFIGNRSELEDQTALALQQAIDAVSRHTVPVWQRFRWRQLTLKQSERNSIKTALLLYGEDAVHGYQPGTGIEYLYGVPAGLPTSSFPVPDELRNVLLICNRLRNPSLTLVAGIDYVIDTRRHAIVFRENPFDNDLVAVQDVYEEGEVSDREAGLWLFMAEYEDRIPFLHVGYVVGVQAPSSDSYRDLLNAVHDACVEGTARRHVEEVISAIIGIPLVKTDGEVIEDIRLDSQHLLVLSDKNVYKFHQTATVLVAVGDTVNAGDSLTDGLQIFEFQNGTLPPDTLQIAYGLGFLPPGYFSGLAFENRSVPTEVGSDGVFTTIRFPLGGWPGDVDRFWEDFHSRGVAAGTTLAQLLDVRETPVGEPDAASLPATINPAQFLIENVLRYHAFLVRVRVDQMIEDDLELGTLRILRRLLPPHTAMILDLQLSTPPDSIEMGGAGSTTVPGYTENPQLFSAANVPDDTIGPDLFIEENPVLRHVAGYCG